MRIKTVSGLGLLVRDQRKRKGWSQAELAEKTGVGRLWISHLEQGKSTLEIDLVFKTLRTLGISLEANLVRPNPFAEIFGE